MATPPFKVKAVHDYSSPHEEDLNFVTGDIITVTEEEDADWYVGEYTNASGNLKSGLFPRNFVERYEPAAPPRPTRSRPKKDTAVDTPIEASVVRTAHEDPVAPDVSQTSAPEAPAAAEPPEPKLESAKAAPVSLAKVPPAVSEKPSSFKDRIAAFNKSAAPPIAPKPAGAPSGQTFIKKPFVAPPPARNSYVPPPKDHAPIQKTYRRDEDPEIAEEQARAQRDAQAAGLTGDNTIEAAEGEDAPKPTSLKDRIALLQKQQQEQAARRADATSKDKPKRPSKPPTDAETGEALNASEVGENAPDSTRQSLDEHREVSKPPIARTQSRDDRAAASIVSDGNEADQSGAGETTEDAAEDESTEVDEPAERPVARPSLLTRTSTSKTSEKEAPVPVGHGDNSNLAEEQDEDEDEEEEEELDPEVRRKMELRERMAKMSGGMGMPGMFAPMAPPKRSKPTKKANDEQEDTQSPPPVQRAPMIPIPGMPPRVPRHDAESVVSNELEDGVPPMAEQTTGEVADVEDLEPQPSLESSTTVRPAERGLPPPVPNNRPSVPEARGAPPPPPRPSDPVAADVEAEEALIEGRDLPSRGVPPPVPGGAGAVASLHSARPDGPRSPPISHSAKRSSAAYPTSPPQVPVVSPEEKRTSRIPPIPGSVPMSPPPIPAGEARAPPPPPPTAAPPSRQNTEPFKQEDSDGESEYEGDYDTDIANGAAHKDALKSHMRDQSADETLSEGPHSPVQRPAPPPPPHQTPKIPRAVDTPRGAPPPPPPREHGPSNTEADYDPYRYSGVPAAAIGQFREDDTQQASDPSLYGKSPPPPIPREAPQSPPPQVHAAPPPLPPQHQELPPIEMSGARPSNEGSRRSLNPSRRSMEQGRSSTEQGVTARDVDLGLTSLWWTHPNTTPPVFQERPDILYEIEETSSTKRGGRTIVSRDVYILFPDYSQTIVTARFDPKEPSNVQLEQRHEPAPPRPSQEVLEHAHSQFAGGIMASASQLVNAAAVEGGTSQGLVRKCIASVPGALAPIGNRAYGATVYANLGNASVSQADEIRPGDIVSFRNARFQGKHGAMHAKYSIDIAGEHVAIVSEWDGTKKKVRVWEQGRPDASGKLPGKDKVKVDSFKFGDLRSGEVKVWRVMGRSWVGWEGDGQ